MELIVMSFRNCGLGMLVALLTLVPVARGQVKPLVSVSVKESYDSNVFLQDKGPLAKADSMVTSVNPFLGIEYKPEAFPDTKLILPSPPDANCYPPESDESYIRHNFSGNLSLKKGPVTVETVNTICLT